MNTYLLSRRKRLLDLAVAIPVMALCLPFFPVLALAVWIASPGPLFFTQERLGLCGKPFQIWKIRTMYPEAAYQPALPLPDDPRVYKMGRIIRAAHVDELPQLWNVIHGEMSVVGPRPVPGWEHDAICQRSTEQQFRLQAKPGITGMAQVSVTWADPVVRANIDHNYVQHASLTSDLQIIARTLIKGLATLAHRSQRNRDLRHDSAPVHRQA